ncbi:Tkl protein kinase, partial [Globisporangium polare]
MGDTEAVKKLLADGAPADDTSSDGRTALFYAAECGQADTAQMLLAHGASVSAKSRSSLPGRKTTTPLLLAGRAGHVDIFKTLIEREAPVNVRVDDAEGETPLISCARWDYFAGVQLLMAHGGALRTGDFSQDECSLISGTLETMERLCRAACELEPICTGVLARLQDICSQLQALDDMEYRAGTLVSFASIIFRFCRLMLQFEKKRTPLLRFIGSRAMRSKVEEFHDELDHFLGMSKLENNGTNWKAQLEKEKALLLGRFKDALRTKEDLLSEICYDDVLVVAFLLQYERDIYSKKRKTNAEQVIAQVLQRFLLASGLRAAPELPEWLISPDDVEFHPWNFLRSEIEAQYYEGKWQKTSVMIEVTKDYDHVKNAAEQWYQLSHPNVVKLFGACHFGASKFFVYEFVPGGKQLQDFLQDESNRPLTWKLLYQAALGLQYIHNRGVVHGALYTDSIIVGSNFIAQLGGLRRSFFGGDGRSRFHWKSSETADDPYCTSIASDVYAFGMCIWEAATLELPWRDTPIVAICANLRTGRLPDRPTSMDDAVWDLVTKMCTFKPSARVNIDYVVNRLSQFVSEREHSGGIIGFEASASSSVIASRRSRSLAEQAFAEFEGATIPHVLDSLESKCEKLFDQPWITENVYPAFKFIFTLLQERQMTPVDVEVIKFCDALARFQRYIRTAVSEKSIFELARSRRVAESHHVVYSDLDRLLDMLEVPEMDRIRVWKYDAPDGDNQVVLGGASLSSSSTSYLRQANESSSAVSLKHFEAPPSGSDSHELWTRDGLLAHGSTASLSWYLALRELLFSEADQIGQGAFGAVYKGSWLDTPVVVKFMGYEGDAGSISTDLLLHEVRVWHRLNHPHVLKLYGACHMDKCYFVCEHASNGDLTDYLKKKTSGANTKSHSYVTWQKMHEAALGLEYLHGLNIAHNDLKCDNIMVGMDGKAKLIDFGLSCLLDVAEIQIDVKKMGALHWRSPEYLVGGRPSTASDVYSFAMCIIEVVSGDIPWGKSMLPTVVRIRVKKGLRPPLSECLNDKQRNLVELMTKLNPLERVKMGFVVDKLYEIVQDEQAAAGGDVAP